MAADARRRIPSVERLVSATQQRLPKSVAGPAVRRFLTELARIEVREVRWLDQYAAELDELADGLAAEATALLSGRLGRVINASGVILQTNLGRSPLSTAAIDRLVEVAAGYSNLEYDLERGRRGERAGALSRTFEGLLGVPALVVNNNAAALLLVLTALAKGKEVVVSRGELIEIGGSFRLPDVMRLSGARMVEVGTTNRTRLGDYRAAVGPKTALLLKVHTSNYRVVGFTESADLKAIAELARASDALCVEDLGSGSLLPTSGFGLAAEPTVAETLAAGADLVTFSGDKLLGGPQAGIVAGRHELIAKLGRHPLYRALRPDKLTLAALEATLLSYVRGAATADLPTWRMIAMSGPATRRRARALADALSDVAATQVVAIESTVGGGSVPGSALHGYGLALSAKKRSVTEVAARLRHGSPPVIARVQDDRLLIDPRTVLPEDEERLLAALRAALS